MAENKRKWYLIDAEGKSLGRLASELATILRGKNLVTFTPHLDLGGYVVVINTDKIKITGKKAEQEKYFHYSGYPGGMKATGLGESVKKDSGKALCRTVRNMLPANKLRAEMMKRLKTFPGAEHSYAGKLK